MRLGVQALSFNGKKSSAAHRPPATCSLLAARATTLEHGSGGEAAVRGGLRFARRGGCAYISPLYPPRSQVCSLSHLTSHSFISSHVSLSAVTCVPTCASAWHVPTLSDAGLAGGGGAPPSVSRGGRVSVCSPPTSHASTLSRSPGAGASKSKVMHPGQLGTHAGALLLLLLLPAPPRGCWYWISS